MIRLRACFLLGIALVAVASIPAHAAGIVVEGVVRSTEGNGVSGARVELRPAVSRYAAGLAELEEIHSAEPPPVAKAGTDRMGRFRLTVPEAGLWRLVAVADGFVPMEIAALPVLEEISLPPVTLRSDAGLRVRVVDLDGNPVPGAQVLGKTGKTPLWGSSDWQPVRRVAMTGPEGTLRLPRAAIEPLLLWAERPGFPVQGESLAEGRETVLRLQPGVARFFVALDAEGHPLPEALFRDPRSSLALGRFDGQHPLALAAPAAGLWDLRVELADGRTMSFRTAEAQRPDGTVPIPLRLSAAVPLAGRIVDATGRRPLAGALVWAGSNPGGVTRTDAAGAYRLAAQVPGSRLDLRAAAAGHQPGQLKVALPSRSSENPRRAPDLALVPAPVPAIAGVVVDEGARPLANAEIRLFRPKPDTRWSAEEPRLARSSADGSFRIAPLQAGGLYVLTASRPGFAPRILVVTLPLAPRSRSPVRLALTRGRMVSGLVLDPRQRPIPGAIVKLTDGRPESAFETQPELGPFRAETDAGGRFQVPGLPAGLFELRIEGPELAPLRARLISVPKGEGLVDLGTFTLEGRPRIGGWIADPGGRPVEGAEIWVVPEESTTITQAGRQAGPAAVTGGDGHFELRDRSVGDHEKLRACRKGFLPAEFQAQDPATGEPRVALTPSTQIAGRVTNAAGEPLAGMDVRASLSGQVGTDLVLPDPPCPSEDFAVTDAEGAFALELKGPGRYDVTSIGPGYLFTEQKHVLVPPEGLDGLEIRLGGGTVVSGRVSDTEGRAIAGASLTLTGAKSYSQTSSDSHGDYLLEGVGPGDDQLEVEHPDFETASLEVHIPDTAYRMNLTLLSPKSRLEARGRVIDPDGVPVEGAIVSGSATRTATLADGSFAVRVDKGAGRLVVEKEGFVVASLDVMVENRSLEGLEIRLSHGLTLIGRVLGVDPAAVTESSIAVYPQGGCDTLAPLDSTGRFEVHNLPSGEWDLSARAGDRQAMDRVTPTPGQAEVVHDLEFAPVSEVWGRITGPGGELIAGASLELTGDHGEQFHAQTRVDGSFTLEVPDGSYTLSASAEGYSGPPADHPVVVAGGPVGNVELQLGANIVLTGRLLGLERGDTLKALQIEGPPWFHPGAWTVDQDAHYWQPGLWPGDWTVSATFLMGTQERYASGTVHIPKGATEATLDLDFHIGDPATDPKAP
jgi:protocatechuate 3,4-dioxygenase beta subunit